MLEITIPASEFLVENNSTFITIKKTTLQLEHSLLSISKWESRHEKPFLGDGRKKMSMDPDEFRDYVLCMTITKNVDPNVYLGITPDIQRVIERYINAPMTATTFSNTKTGNSTRIVTSEIIYYDMIEFGIPFECQKWHLNRLLTLIRVCSIKHSKPEKVPYKEMVAERRALNAARLKGGRKG